MLGTINLDEWKVRTPDLKEPNKLVTGFGPRTLPQIFPFIVCGNVGAVKLLIEHGASLNQRNEDGSTTVLYAVQSNQINILKILLDAGTLTEETLNLSTKRSKFTPLSFALQEQNVEAIKMLAPIMNLNKKSTTDHVTPIYQAINKIGIIKKNSFIGDLYKANLAVEILFNYKFDPNIAEENGISPLMLACQFNLHPIVKKLLLIGANPNQTTRNGHTALFYAAETGNIDLLRALLESGARKDVHDTSGKTAYDFALKHENLEIRAILKEIERR